MWDTISGNPEELGDEFNRIPGGCNVLYMDGHAEFLKYPSTYPVSVSWATVLGYL